MSEMRNNPQPTAVLAPQPAEPATPTTNTAIALSASLDADGRAAHAHAPQRRNRWTAFRRGARRALLWALATLTLLGLCAALAPDHPGVNQLLAAAASARAVYRYDRALNDYAQAQAQAPQDARPLCGVGEVRAAQRQPRQAIAAFQACLALTPNAPDATQANVWQALGDAQQELGNGAAAQADWGRAAARGSLAAERELAQQAEAQGDAPTAIHYWTQLTASPFDAAEAQIQLGYLALWSGDAAGAQAHLLAAAATSSAVRAQLQASGMLALAAIPQTTADALTRLGYALLAADLPALAVRPLLRATALAPQVGIGHALLGWAYLQTGRRALAQREIPLGAQLAPGVSFAQYAAGELALANGKPAQAITSFQRGLALDPHNVALWSALGQAQLDVSAYFAAEFSLQNAAQLSGDPADTVTFVRYYVDHLLGLASGRALAAAVAATHRWPGSEQLWYLLGVVNDLTGQRANAYYAFTQALALDAGDPNPYVYLGRYAEDEGNNVVAALNLRTALAISPEGPNAAQARALLAPLADIPV